MKTEIFPIITAADWRQSIAEARATPNAVRDEIRAKLLASGKAWAVPVGIQRGYGVVPDFELFNLLVALPGHPVGSTVTAKTLRKYGVPIPRAALAVRQSPEQAETEAIAGQGGVLTHRPDTGDLSGNGETLESLNS